MFHLDIYGYDNEQNTCISYCPFVDEWLQLWADMHDIPLTFLLYLSNRDSLESLNPIYDTLGNWLARM